MRGDEHLYPDGQVAADALGAGLLACWNGGQGLVPAIETLEFHDGSEYQSQFERYFDGPDTWTALDRWVAARCRGQVLDIGTGAGRYAIELESRPGVDHVVGIDISDGAVKVARARGLDATVASIHDHPVCDHQVDTILLLGNNLGLLAPDAQPHDVLKSLRDFAEPGARLLGTSSRPSKLPQHVQDANVMSFGRPGRFDARIRFGDVTGGWFPYEFWEPTHFMDVAGRSGWITVDVTEDSGQWGIMLATE